LKDLSLHLVNDFCENALVRFALLSGEIAHLLGCKQPLLKEVDSLLVAVGDGLEPLLMRLSCLTDAYQLIEQDTVLLV
jgi:hypothetical protein